MTEQNTIAETQAYLKQAEKIGLSEEERDQIKDYLSKNPEAGDLIQGSGGVRKVRFGFQGKGKSGGVRLFTFYWSAVHPLYLLAVLAKSRKANLTKAQIAALAQITKELKDGQ